MNAKTKGEAIELLDEWGNAEQALLTRMTDCMFEFRLTDEGQIELANISEYTEGRIMKTCYPNLSEVSHSRIDEKGMDHSRWDASRRGKGSSRNVRDCGTASSHRKQSGNRDRPRDPKPTWCSERGRESNCAGCRTEAA